MYWRKKISDQLSESLFDALFLPDGFTKPIWKGYRAATREGLRSPGDHPVSPLWNKAETCSDSGTADLLFKSSDEVPDYVFVEVRG